MGSSGADSSEDAQLVRSSAFAYACHACKRCCEGKLIRVNPYEALHLSRALGVSTTTFLARHVDRQTAFLKLGTPGHCAFLDTRLGCSVHAHRPLVCRLYPLGRRIDTDGVETFSEMTGHPDSAGVRGGAGSVADYLDAQGAQPFIAAADRLLALFQNLLGATASARPAAGPDIDWLDPDIVVERLAGLPVDTTVTGIERMFDAYLAAIENAIASTRSSGDRHDVHAPP